MGIESSPVHRARAPRPSVRAARRLWMWLGLLLLILPAPPAGAAQHVPNGFDDRLVATVDLPTDIAFAGDVLLVTSQAGKLSSGRVGDAALRTVLDLSGALCANFERGLLGVAPDPSFAANGHVYVYYTKKNASACPTTTTELAPLATAKRRALAECDAIRDRQRRVACKRAANREFAPPPPPGTLPVNRVSRFTLGAGDAARTEKVLVDNIPAIAGNHNGGDLEIAGDGNLYVSVGDAGCQLGTRVARCSGENANALNGNVLVGKILRITPDGGIPPGNPYRAGGEPCAKTGRSQGGKVCQEIYALGLRNPFRFAFDPNTAGAAPRFFINDVGSRTWEEIDEGKAGANYGWNVCEGAFVQGSTTERCTQPRSEAPVFAYPHAGGCRSITGGAFSPPNALGGGFKGTYFYADFVCEKIFVMDADDAGARMEPFASGLGGVVPLAFAPDGDLYYGTYTAGGQIRKIGPATAGATAANRTTGADGPVASDAAEQGPRRDETPREERRR